MDAYNTDPRGLRYRCTCHVLIAACLPRSRRGGACSIRSYAKTGLSAEAVVHRIFCATLLCVHGERGTKAAARIDAQEAAARLAGGAAGIRGAHRGPVAVPVRVRHGGAARARRLLAEAGSGASRAPPPLQSIPQLAAGACMPQVLQPRSRFSTLLPAALPCHASVHWRRLCCTHSQRCS